MENNAVGNIKNGSVIVGQTYNVPASKVWRALTDVEQMKQWYFDLVDFKPEVGFSFQFLAGTEEKKWLHLCKVTAVDPGHKLTYSWRYDGYDGISFVTFELVPVYGGTKLVLTHDALDTFPPLPEFAKENFLQGWTYFAGKALPEFLNRNAS